MIALLLFTTLLHPVHETVTEVQWNADAQVLEVAVRLDVLDEQWIQRRDAGQRSHRLWAIEYLKEHVVLDPVLNPDRPDATAPRPSYRWVGREQEGSHVWWYFEIAPADRLSPRRIQQTMLFESSEQFTNRVLVIGNEGTFALNLTKVKSVGSLIAPPKTGGDPEPSVVKPADL